MTPVTGIVRPRKVGTQSSSYRSYLMPRYRLKISTRPLAVRRRAAGERSLGVASAIVGASRPEQVVDNVGASGVTLDPDLMAAIDGVLSGVVVTDPSLTVSPNPRP